MPITSFKLMVDWLGHDKGGLSCPLPVSFPIVSPLSSSHKFATLSSNSDLAYLAMREALLSGKSQRLRLREVGWSWPVRLSWSQR